MRYSVIKYILKDIFQRRNNVIARFISTNTRRSEGLSKNITDKLTVVVGSKNVSSAQTVRDQHGVDEGPHSAFPPDLVVWPENTIQVSEIAKICYSHSIPMIPYGTGTGLEQGVGALQGGVCLDLSHMTNIYEVHQEDFDVTVDAGVTRLALNNYIRDTGLWFPVDPGADASLGGMAATSASGTNAVRYGTMKENILNLEVVLPDGSIMHTGGKDKRARKSVAGYNLTSLFVGSEGTLGFITKVTLKLHGIPEKVVSSVCPFSSIKEAVDTVIMILQCNVNIARIELLDDVAIEASNKYSGLDNKVTPTLFMEFHGNNAEVKSQVEVVEEIAKNNGCIEFYWAHGLEERNKLWTARHNLLYATLALRPGHKSLTTDVCVPISKLSDIIVETKEDIVNSGVFGSVLGHVGDGNFHTFLLFKQSDEKELLNNYALANRMAERALSYGGTCSGEHGIGIGKKELLKEEYGEIGISVMKQIKKSLDPKNLMNPGKIIEV